MPRVLLIEDDYDLATAVIQELHSVNFEVTHCADGEAGLLEAKRGTYDVVILDLMLPAKEGLEVCRGIRAAEILTPIVVLTSRADEADKVALLELGADDYITKPFGLAEFRARIKAAVRRGEQGKELRRLKALHIADLEIDTERRKVFRGGVDIGLTTREFDYVYLLASNRGRVFTREELGEIVHGYEAGDYGQSVSAAINRIRAKLEPEPTKPKYILTAWGAGYRFAEED